MAETLKAALADSPAGVVEVVVDGTKVSFDRRTAIEELQRWERQAAKAAGTRSRIASINLETAW